MAAAGKQWAPRPVRPPSPPPPGAARRGLPPPLRAFSDSRPRQRRPGPAQPPLGLPPPGPAPLRSRPGRDLATDPRLASAASPCPPGSVWNLQQPRRWGGGEEEAAEQKPYQARGPGAPWAGRSTQGARTRRPRRGVVAGGLAAERVPAFLSPGTSPHRPRARAPTDTSSGTNMRGKLGLGSRAGDGPSRKWRAAWRACSVVWFRRGGIPDGAHHYQSVPAAGL